MYTLMSVGFVKDVLFGRSLEFRSVSLYSRNCQNSLNSSTVCRRNERHYFSNVFDNEILHIQRENRK